MRLDEIQVGKRVHYHPVIDEEHDGKVYTIRAIGTLPSGQDVAWLAGKSGCVAREALSTATKDAT